MSKFVVTGVFTILAGASALAAAGAVSDAIGDPSLRAWGIVGFVVLRTAVLCALSVCVFTRSAPRRQSRDPVAFIACAAALLAIPALEAPAASAPTFSVVTGDLLALVASCWLLASFVALGRCFGLLPEARGLVTRGPYRFVRHPVYLGEFGAMAGLVIASLTVRNLCLAAVFAGAQAIRMRMEERALEEEFPEYSAYATATPRLLPRLRYGHARSGAAIAGACLVAVLVASPVTATVQKATVGTPALEAPSAGIRTDGVPWFGWAPVSGASHYEFQIAADAGMNAPVLGRREDRFFTKNTRATLRKSLPDRTYWWRVRAVTEKGEVSSWTSPRAFAKSLPPPTLRSPIGGLQVVFPTTPLKLEWSPVDRAVKYVVTLAADQELGTIIDGRPVETFATSFTRPGVLPPGPYYWRVTPIDAQGNPGTPSKIESFVWMWPTETSVRVRDLIEAPEMFDPQFSWDRVDGAARYEIEVNPSVDFAPGSKVCCPGTTVGTVYSPTRVFKDNRYYWRVRAIDVDGNPGTWNYGEPFDKRFDKVVPPGSGTSIKNVRLRDNVADPGIDAEPATPGSYETHVPLLTWDPVPGASSYQVDVTPMGVFDCDWSAKASHWLVYTAVNAWAPLGNGAPRRPYPDENTLLAAGDPALINGAQYCARIRARTDRDADQDEVYGDYTYVVNGRTSVVQGPAFKWVGPPSGGACTPSCTPGYVGASDYLTPVTGTLTPRTPYFTWKPIAGKRGYFVIVSKDSNFSNIVDYAFTELPAYSPRGGLLGTTTYTDETTSYYWAILPVNADGTDAVGNPFQAAPQTFDKRSVPPQPVEPSDNTQFFGHPSFRWTPVEGARRYHVQVAQDDRFGATELLEDVVTDSTAYTSNTTYPADTRLYWRVRADDENRLGLTWSTAGMFQKRLDKPIQIPNEPARGDSIPTWKWHPVLGAVSYDVHVDLPDGTQRDLNGMRTPALTPVVMFGTGVFRWSVRANFPRQPFGTVAGPYSPTLTFTRTIAEPVGVRSDNSKRYPLLLWDPKPGPKSYLLQISTRRDFARLVEAVATDNTSYAPLLMKSAYAGGPLYWRLAAVDEGRNVGDWSPTQQIGAVRTMRLAARGQLKRRKMRRVVVSVSSGRAPIVGAAVRVSGSGARRMVRRTNRRGVVTFRIRPTKRGVVLFQATKSGYASARLRLRVR